MDRQDIPTLQGFGLSDGFHGLERDHFGPFVWSKRSFSIRRPKSSRYLALKLCYYGQNGRLDVACAGRGVNHICLHSGWSTYPVDLGAADSEELQFQLNEIIPVPGDSRELGVMIRSIKPFEDQNTYALLSEVRSNKQINHQEFLQGRTVLESFPPNVIINIATRCQMNPRCVYCEWNSNKAKETQCDYDFTCDSLAQMGRFYRLSDQVIDASYGEALDNESVDHFLRTFDRDGKFFEITTSGLTLDSENSRRLLGKNGAICVSVDSVTADGYRRYRKPIFDQVIANLRRFCRRKQHHHNLPIVIVSFIAMRSNRSELPDFLGLMKDVGVDCVKLRSLDDNGTPNFRVVVRNGFRFDYDAELLSLAELAELTEHARAIAADKGIHLIIDLDRGNVDINNGQPICAEPWTNFYLLKRGFITCCFDKGSMVPWSDMKGRPLEEFLREVFNSPQYQKLRHDLAHGQLPPRCLLNTSCPIVKKMVAGSRDPTTSCQR